MSYILFFLKLLICSYHSSALLKSVCIYPKSSTSIKTEYIQNKEFIISVEDEKPLKIPYANDGEYLVPIFTDEKEYLIAMDYFSLNDMSENNEYIIEKLDYFKKLKEDPNFLGYIVNIARVSYIINSTLL